MNHPDLPDGVGLRALSPDSLDDMPTSESLTMVTLKNDKAALANKNGKIIIKTNYDWIGSFHNDLALVKINGELDGNEPKPDWWGYININGVLVIPLKQTGSYPFSEGLAPVQDSRGKFGFINTHGKVVIKPQYDDAEEFSNGEAQVKLNQIWIWINQNGERVR